MLNETKLMASVVLSLGVVLGASALALLDSEPDPRPRPVDSAFRYEECKTQRVPGTPFCLPAYCERFPMNCTTCERPPCDTPISLVCCEGSGCWAVNNYSDCDGDIYWCEYGYQGRHEDGTPYVICYDE